MDDARVYIERSEAANQRMQSRLQVRNVLDLQCLPVPPLPTVGCPSVCMQTSLCLLLASASASYSGMSLCVHAN